jgi:hypothetical protein
MSMQPMRLSAIAVILAGMSVALAQGETPSASTTGLAPADRPYNNDQPSLAGQVVPSPQDAAAYNAAVFARDQLPTIAHTFNFTAEQKQQIRDALAPDQGQAADVKVTAGTELPQPLDVKPMPDAVTQQMPWVKPYKYVKLGNKIAIVDPYLPVVVSVIE